MAETGLTFTSDGSGAYKKTLNQILDVSDRLDKMILKIVKDTRKWKTVQEELNATITSSTRRMNTLIDRVNELDVAFREVISRIPQLEKELKKGFEGGNLDKFMQNKGTELGEAFMRGMETELGIASPSKRMKYVAGEIERGFEIGLKAGRWAASGTKIATQFVTGFVKKVSSGMRDGMSAVLRAVRTGVEQIEAELDKAGRAMRDKGGSMVSAGLGAMATGGLIAGATIGISGAAVSQAVQFEQIMTNTGAIMGQNREEMKGLNEELLRVGGQSLAGVDATATAFYDIVSGVQDSSLHMGILNAAIATSEAGQADLTTTTAGLVAMMNSYTASGVSAGLASDVFSRTVQMGVGSMDGFVAAMSPIAGLASSVGVGIEELGAGMAFLTAKGATTGAAATRLQSAMVSLLKPNIQMAAALQAAGYESGEAAIEALGLAGALDVVNTALDDDSAAFAAALGSTEALQGAVGLLSDDYEDFYTTYSEGLDGATDRSRAIQLEGTYAIFQQIQSAVGALAVEIGNELLPMVRLLAEGFLFVVNSVLTFLRENRALVGTVVRIATIMGVLLGAIIAVGGAIAVIGGIFAIAGGFVLSFTATLIGFAVASIGFADDILIIVGLFGLFEDGIFGMESALGRFMGILNNVKAGLRAVTGSEVSTATDSDPKAMEQENALLRERDELMRDIAKYGTEIVASQEHQVESGDTLWDIAQRYGTTVEALRDANDIEGSMLGIGQELVIPVGLDSSEFNEELAQMESDLEIVNEQLEDFVVLPPEGLETMNDDMQSLVNSADLVVAGFMSMFSGDITGGIEQVRSGFVGIGDAVGNLWGRFQGGMAENSEAMANPFGESFADQIQADGGGANPIMSWLSTVIDEASNMDFSTLSQTIADNLDTIVSTALTIVGMVIGFPVGSTIGFARMVVWAVENDFMGIGTLLAESGALDFFETAWDSLVADFDAFIETTGLDLHLNNLIGDAVETDLAGLTIDLSVLDPVFEAFTIMKTALTDGLATLFTGLFGDASQTENPFGESFADQIQIDETPFQSAITSLEPLLTLIIGMGQTALDNLPVMAQGIVDFFTALGSGIDMDTMGDVLTFIGVLIGAIVSLGTIVGSGLLGGLSAAASDIGNFFAELINAAGSLLTGDLGGMLTALAGAFGSLLTGIGNFTVGAADGVITALNNLFGIELPSVDEGLAAYAGAFEMAWLALEVIIDNTKRGISQFALGIRTDILELLAGLRDDIYEGSLQTIDIAPNINVELESAQGQGTAMETQDAIAQSMNEQIRENGAIDLTVPIEINGEITELGTAIENVATADFGTANSAAIAGALGFAYESGDLETLKVLLPLAMDLDLDVSGIVAPDTIATDIAAALAEGDTGEATEMLSFASSMGIDIDEVFINLGEMGVDDASMVDLVQWGLTGALGEGDAELATDLVRIATPLEIEVTEILTNFEGSYGYEAVREALILSMAGDAEAGDEEGLALQVPIALAMGVTEDEVLEAANEAGMLVGQDIELGLNTSLGIESPSQVGIDTGMFIMEGISIGMSSMLHLLLPVINTVLSYIDSIPKQMYLAETKMTIAAKSMADGFQNIADDAKGLWNYLNAIKLMMGELGMTVGEANAAVAGGAGNTGQDILAAAGWESAGAAPQGKALGGEIRRGEWYETNEGGITESAVIGGRSYLLAGDDGYVTPMSPISDVMGAGAGVGGSSGGSGGTINYNGDFVMQIPPEADDPESFAEWFVDAMDEYNSQTTISDRFRNKI